MEAKPNLKKFKITPFRGYDMGEVNAYVQECDGYKVTMSEQNALINELKDEISELRKKLEEFEKQENNISGTLLHANQKADQIVGDAKMLADAEIHRVNMFRMKWESYAERLLSELAPKQRRLYDKLLSRIDEAVDKFAEESKHTEIARYSVNTDAMAMVDRMENAMYSANAQTAGANRRASTQTKPRRESGGVQHAIELDEVYDTNESLSDLISDLD